MNNLYVVMRLNTQITSKNILGEDEEITLKGCAGYLPVFDTMEEAIISSAEGKYDICVMEIKK